MTDIVDQLRQAPALGTSAEDVPGDKQEPEQRGPRGGRRPAGSRQQRRAERQPFAEGPPPEQAAADPFAQALFTVEDAQKLRVLWDEYLQRQQAEMAPKTQRYRCLAVRPNGAPCGAVVEAGTPEERRRTGEVVRCPHGPDDPQQGIFFDRERYPRYHHELTPMEPIA